MTLMIFKFLTLNWLNNLFDHEELISVFKWLHFKKKLLEYSLFMILY